MVSKTKTSAVDEAGMVAQAEMDSFVGDLKTGEVITGDDFHWPKLEDIQEALSAPFDEGLIEYLPKGGRQLAYVSWNEYVKRLNALAYGHWSTRISGVNMVENGQAIIRVEVSIFGTTHEDISDVDNPTSAYATALKRACSKFGLGLYLYDMGGTGQTSSRPTQQSTYDTTSQNQQGQYTQTGKPTAKMVAALVERNRIPKSFVDTLDFDTASAIMNDLIQNHMSLKQVADKYGFSLPSDGLPIR